MSSGKTGYPRSNLPKRGKRDFERRLDDVKNYAYELGNIYPAVSAYAAHSVPPRRYKRLRYEFDRVFISINGHVRSYSDPKKSFLAKMRELAPDLYEEFILGEETYTIHHAYPLSLGGTNDGYLVALAADQHVEVDGILQDQVKDRRVAVRKPFEPFLLLSPKFDGRLLYTREEYDKASNNFFRQFSDALAWAKANGA
jgi:hypothetical protein